MKISVDYDKAEVERMLLVHHESKFGEAPVGQKWSLETGYGFRWTITNEPISGDKAEGSDAT